MTTVNNEDRVSNAIKTPNCDIKRENYLQWKIKWKAFLSVKGFQGSLKRGVNPDIPATESIDLSSYVETKKKGEMVTKKNDVAMVYIFQVMKTQMGMRIIPKGKNWWPDGLFHMAMDYVNKKKNPNETMDRVELKNACKKISMNKNYEPTHILNK